MKFNWRPTASIEAIRTRARMLKNVRAFFAARDVLEVETPALSTAAITDPNLHSFKTHFSKKPCYLQTSPEFFMKRLLASGSGDIYQICKVYRDMEQGKNHNPEFTMLEWYRTGKNEKRLMDEIENLFEYLINTMEINLAYTQAKRISYQQAFMETFGIDVLEINANGLQEIAQQNNIEIPVGMDRQSKDMWLDWLLGQSVSAKFQQQGLTFLYDYPASQAALARLNANNSSVAHRFEVFYGKLELANGFYELTDQQQQRKRFENENEKRARAGLQTMPVDENLLAALDYGLPECSGVAVGLDRLLMVLMQLTSVDDVLSFSFDRV